MGCINNNSNDNDRNETIDFSYLLTITTNTSNQFLINVPCIIIRNQEISNLNDKITVLKGNCNFEFVESYHGKALQIVTNENLTMGFEHSREIIDNDLVNNDPNYFLSMDNDIDLNGDYTEWGNDAIENWFYLNSTFDINITIDLIFTVGTSNLGGGFELDGYINQIGWTTINGIKSYTMD